MIRPTHPAVDGARRELLERLHRTGPVPPAEIPGRWPLTRHHLRLILTELIRDGLVTTDREPGGSTPRLSLTPAGREVVRAGG